MFSSFKFNNGQSCIQIMTKEGGGGFLSEMSREEISIESITHSYCSIPPDFLIIRLAL